MFMLFSLFLFFWIISTTYDLMLSVLLLSASETFNFSPVKDVSAKLAFWLTLQLSVAVLHSKPIIVMGNVFGI